MYVAMLTFVRESKKVGASFHDTEETRAFGPFPTLPSEEKQLEFDMWADSIFEPGLPITNVQFFKVSEVPPELLT